MAYNVILSQMTNMNRLIENMKTNHKHALFSKFNVQISQIQFEYAKYLSSIFLLVPYMKVNKGAKIRNRYNRVLHLTQDTNGKVTNSVRHHRREPRGQPFPSR